MFPTGQESGETRSADRDAEPSAIQQLVETVARLAAIAESDLPPPARLELLRVQIGTAQFWAEQVGAADRPMLHGPHWQGSGAAARSTADDDPGSARVS
jgi:hypothetical protein